MGFIDFIKNRAQASTEYLALVGFALLAIAIISGYGFFLYNNSLANNQAKTAMVQVTGLINDVGSLGSGNQLIVTVRIPDSIEAWTVGHNFIQMRSDSFGSSTDDLTEFDVNLIGTLPISPGTWTVIAQNNNGEVKLSYA